VGLDVRQIGDPQAVRRLGSELAFDQVRRPRRRLAGECGADDLAAHHTADAEIAHQSLHGAPRHGESLTLQLGPHLVSSVDPTVLVPDARDLVLELVVMQAAR